MPSVDANHATVFVFEAFEPTVQLLAAHTIRVEVELMFAAVEEPRVKRVPVA